LIGLPIWGNLSLERFPPADDGFQKLNFPIGSFDCFVQLSGSFCRFWVSVGWPGPD
jgi:hypothetical protein